MDQSWGWAATSAATSRYAERLADSEHHRRLAELPRAPRPRRARRLLTAQAGVRARPAVAAPAATASPTATAVAPTARPTLTKGVTMQLDVALPHEMLVQEHQQTLMAEAAAAHRRRELRRLTPRTRRAILTALLARLRTATRARRRRSPDARRATAGHVAAGRAAHGRLA